MDDGGNEVIEIEGIDPEHPTRGDGEGTLYTVAIKLKQEPSQVWVEHFPQNWNQPQEYTLRHRPGIARVSGDRIFLEGTTMEEVRDIHKKTLELAVAVTNQQAAEYKAQYKRDQEAKAAQRKAREENVRKVASEIEFG